MEDITSTEEGRRILRWGGLAGVLGAILMFVTFGVVGAFVVPVAATPEELVARFPEIRAARTVENGLYLAAVTLWLIHITALGHALRGAHLAASLFGRTFATLGVIALAAGALPHIATIPISELYHRPGAGAQEQATLVQVFRAIQGIFDALLVTGLLVLPLGLIGLGVAMRASPIFGIWPGTLTVGVGAIAFAAALANLVEVSGIVAVGIFALITFNLIVGAKAYRLSNDPGKARLLAAALHGQWSPS